VTASGPRADGHRTLPHVDELLSRVLAFDRGVRLRGAQRVLEIPEGLVVRHDGVRGLYHLNAVLADRGVTDAATVTRLADEHLGDLDHRHVVFDDAELAERLAPELLGGGWKRQRVVFMHHVRDAKAAPRATAQPIDRERARTLQLALLGEEVPGSAPDGMVAPALASLLVAGQEAVRDGTRSIVFAAGEGGTLASMCTLFLDDRQAMIDEVGTLQAHRGRGLARAVVSAALQAARAERCDLIIVPADADDWPQLMYATLGFEPLGRQVAFTKA
jgi:predicted GNAT family acetyltransferase